MCRIMIEKEVCLCSVLAIKEEFGNEEVKSSKITEVWVFVYYSMGFYLLVTSPPESDVDMKMAMHAV